MIIRSIAGWLLVVCLTVPLTAQDKLGSASAKPAGESPWALVDVDTQASLRGLHVRSETDIWASGTGGTIINSTDGGKSWRVSIVAGAEKLDFRDIHAINRETVLAITSGTPACIYRTDDGGSTWNQVYENRDERVFLDALSVADAQNGIVMGDPIVDKLFLLVTSDGGRSWTQSKSAPDTGPGEAGFAASGTNMITTDPKNIFIALGGHQVDQTSDSSRIMVSRDGGSHWTPATVPIQRSPSAGIFSLCFVDSKHGIAVGGDYLKPEIDAHNYAVTSDGGATWKTPSPRRPPSGYRSCVASFVDRDKTKALAVGPNGTDLSEDFGNSWTRVSTEGFHAIDFSPDQQHGWATGADGRVAKWLGNQHE